MELAEEIASRRVQVPLSTAAEFSSWLLSTVIVAALAEAGNSKAQGTRNATNKRLRGILCRRAPNIHVSVPVGSPSWGTEAKQMASH